MSVDAVVVVVLVVVNDFVAMVAAFVIAVSQNEETLSLWYLSQLFETVEFECFEVESQLKNIISHRIF